MTNNTAGFELEGDQDVQEPLLIVSSNNYNHNDPQLLNQQTVLNLNNYNVRLTLWCLIYFVLSGLETVRSFSSYIFYSEDCTGDQFTCSNRETWEQYYSYSMYANSILSSAAAFLLFSMHCPCCNTCKCCKILSIICFIIGGVMLTVASGYVSDKICNGDEYHYDDDYCRTQFVMSSLFTELFSFYMVIDIINPDCMGNKLRVRILIKSLFIAIHSFLYFAYYNWRLDSSMYTFGENEDEFIYRTTAGGHMTVGIVCAIILCLIICGVGTDNNKIGRIGPKLLAFFLLSGAASSYYTSSLVLAAAIILAYDIQYLAN